MINDREEKYCCQNSRCSCDSDPKKFSSLYVLQSKSSHHCIRCREKVFIIVSVTESGRRRWTCAGPFCANPPQKIRHLNLPHNFSATSLQPQTLLKFYLLIFFFSHCHPLPSCRGLLNHISTHILFKEKCIYFTGVYIMDG